MKLFLALLFLATQILKHFTIKAESFSDYERFIMTTLETILLFVVLLTLNVAKLWH
jgi:hypothetical protein